MRVMRGPPLGVQTTLGLALFFGYRRAGTAGSPAALQALMRWAIEMISNSFSNTHGRQTETTMCGNSKSKSLPRRYRTPSSTQDFGSSLRGLKAPTLPAIPDFQCRCFGASNDCPHSHTATLLPRSLQGPFFLLNQGSIVIGSLVLPPSASGSTEMVPPRRHDLNGGMPRGRSPPRPPTRALCHILGGQIETFFVFPTSPVDVPDAPGLALASGI